MRITAVTPDGHRDAEVTALGFTTVAELASALGLGGARWLSVDGTPVATGTHVEEIPLRTGSLVSPLAGPDFAPDPGRAGSDTYLSVCGGLHAGVRVPLRPSAEIVVGRGRDVDLRIRCRTLSVHHLVVGADEDGGWCVRDLGSGNGSRLDGRWLGDENRGLAPGQSLELAASRVRLEPTDHHDTRDLGQPGSDGRTPFNRPPRTAPPPLPSPIPAPPAPGRLAGSAPFSWAMFLAPVIIGLLLAFVFTPVLALVSLAGPVVTLASWFESRRRERRDDTRQDRRFARSLREFEAALQAGRRDTEERCRSRNPDPAELVRRACGPARSVWERRPGHDDFLVARIGTGDLPWASAVAPAPTGDHSPAVETVIASNRVLSEVPVTVDLRRDPCLGIAGPRSVASAVARAILCQLATHQGPADLMITVPTSGPTDEWRWARWLPHLVGPSDVRDRDTEGYHVEVVVEPAGGSHTPPPEISGPSGLACQIVLAPETDLLPSWCDTVVECTGTDGLVRLHRPRLAETHEPVLADGLDTDVAERTARALGRLSDPLAERSDRLPDRLLLGALLELEDPTPELVSRRWAAAGSAPRAVVGVGPDGPFTLDLMTQGPHGLIGGTTGSGKSELLRTLVVSLAATVPPGRLSFLLVDYKGGSAFDACADLPHTVGVVTDLDGRLGERCLRSLEAEIRRREQVLRHHGAGDLDQLFASCEDGCAEPPLARLVVVVDEFAALARELPDFLDALVGIAERGRSLGIHLLLATQRPGGVVSESIKANTNLRIALRMLDRHEAVDVIGDGEAASIPPGLPGRARVRIGPGDPIPLQIALAEEEPGGVEGAVAPGIRWLDDPSYDPAPGIAAGGYLRRLVNAIRVAGERHPRPAAPWLPPLPDRVELSELAPGSGSDAGTQPGTDAPDAVPLALADDPECQRQVPWSWRPGSGNLILYGLPGSGITTALRTTVHSLTGGDQTAGVHVYLVTPSQELADLAELPSVGAVVDSAEPDRLSRLAQVLETTPIPTVVLVDGVGRLLSALDHEGGMAAVERWARLMAEGPARRCWFVLGAERVGAVPAAVSSTARQRLVFRLADPYDYSALGLSPVDPRRLGAGRAIDAATGLEVQVALPGDRPAPGGGCVHAEPPDPIAVLPGRIGLAPLLATASTDGNGLHLPIGVTDSDAPAVVTLNAGDHMLVAGPRGAGCSTALGTLATSVAAADPALPVIATGAGRSPLRTRSPGAVRWVEPGELPAVLDEMRSSDHRWLLLIDDAELVDDATGALSDAIARPGRTSVVAAGWSEGLRSSFTRWTRQLRPARWGLALGAGALDGELWATELPARAGAPAGRGWLLEHGRARAVQVAEP